MTSTYYFTTTEILHKIAFWDREPLPSDALNSLIQFFLSEEDEKYSYKNDNIEEFILDTAKQITE
jgi:hypothetical protein